MKTPQQLVIERDEALDDEAALDRALRIAKLFYLTAPDPQVAKYAEEQARLLIKMRQRARKRHQEAERKRLDMLNSEEITAQLI
jgi:hypothetical protein